MRTIWNFAQTHTCRCQYFSCLYCFQSCYSTKQHLPVCRYRAQGLKEKDGTAAESETQDHPRTEDGENDGNLGTEAESVLRVESAESVQEGMPTKEAVQEYCLLSAEIATQLMSRGARKKV